MTNKACSFIECSSFKWLIKEWKLLYTQALVMRKILLEGKIDQKKSSSKGINNKYYIVLFHRLNYIIYTFLYISTIFIVLTWTLVKSA